MSEDDEPLYLGEPDDLSAIRASITEAEEIRDEWKARALKAEAEVARLRGLCARAASWFSGRSAGFRARANRRLFAEIGAAGQEGE